MLKLPLKGISWVTLRDGLATSTLSLQYIIVFWNFPYPWASTDKGHIAILIYEDKYHATSACNIRYHNGYAISMR